MNITYPTRRRNHARKGSEILSCGSVQVLGYNVYYEASGRAEQGPTILFLHESGGSLATWHGQLVGLAQHARCIVPDLPGHGKSEGSGWSSVRGYREAVLAFLDALAIRWPVVVAGVCLGASIAVDLALHAPERVAGLILSGISEGGRACAEIKEAVARGEAPEVFIKELIGPAASQRLLQERLQRWRLTSPLVRHGDLMALDGYAMAHSLQAVAHAVLVVAGEQDLIATPELVMQMTEQMLRARVVTVPESSCLSMVESPNLFNRAVVEFLNRLRPDAPIEPDVRQVRGYRRS